MHDGKGYCSDSERRTHTPQEVQLEYFEGQFGISVIRTESIPWLRTKLCKDITDEF